MVSRYEEPNRTKLGELLLEIRAESGNSRTKDILNDMARKMRESGFFPKMGALELSQIEYGKRFIEDPDSFVRVVLCLYPKAKKYERQLLVAAQKSNADNKKRDADYRRR